MLITKDLIGLHNGVSQQPAAIRLDTQVAAQTNCLGSLVDGVARRPNTEFIAKLLDDSEPAQNAPFSATSFVHGINRDATERYIFVIDNGNPYVYDLEGNLMTVRVGTLDEDMTFTEDTNVLNYLATTASDRESFVCTTVADYTIVVNKEKVCAKSGSPTAATPPKAIAWVKQDCINTTYTITVDGTSGSYSTGGTVTGTGTIAANLATNLSTALGANYTVTHVGSSVTVERVNDADFTFSVSDSYGNNALKGFKDTVQKFQDLPPQASDGFYIEVMGEESNKFDNYYVKYDTASGYASGVWKETYKSGLDNKFDAATLPHRLVRTGVNEFTFAPINWSERTVGDDISAPDPSFIGLPINDVFFYKNRLGFLSGENVILSVASDFFNFYPSTALDVLADDPIDVAVSSNIVATLHHAVPYDETLLLFSEKQQFVLSSSSGALTPQTATVDPTTAFDTSVKCPPVAVGANVYFVCPSGNFSAVREYFVQPDSLTNDAADVTAHVPRYLPKDIFKLEANTPQDILFALSYSKATSLYVYKYYWKGDEKVQSSWSMWTFGGTILSMVTFDNYLYLVIKEGAEIHLERINLVYEVTAPTFNFKVYLDKLVALDGVYDSNTNTTTWTLPYIGGYGIYKVIHPESGVVIASATGSRSTMTASGRYTAGYNYIAAGQKPFIGRLFTSDITLSEWWVKPKGDSAKMAGVLKIRRVKVYFKDTGYFYVWVNPQGRNFWPYGLLHYWDSTMTGAGQLDYATVRTGQKSFMALCNSKGTRINIGTDSYLPFTVYAVGLEGDYTVRSQTL